MRNNFCYLNGLSKLFFALPVLATCLLVSHSFAQVPAINNIHYGGWIKIVQAPVDTANWMHFPRAISFDIKSGSSIIKKVLLNWETNRDVVQYPMSHGWAGSVNEGVTFNTPSPTITGGTGDLDMMACARRNTDGVMIAIPFYFNNTGANPVPPLVFSYFTSADNGTTWTRQTNGGSITGFPSGTQVAGFRFHRGMIQDADGTLYAPAYAQFKDSGATSFGGHRSLLVKSTNGGATWNYVSTIQYTPGVSYNETTIVRCKDGTILAVMRNDNGTDNLAYRRSPTGSNGASWGPLTTVPLPANAGVDPYLELMPNGILVLSYGDNVPTTGRNCMIAYDVNGNGGSWTNVTSTFVGASGLGNRSSGYTSIFPLRNNQFLQVSDRALYTYYGTNLYPSPNPFSIWTKKVELVLNYRNRIDLKTKYPARDIAVNTDMTYTDAVHPEAGISGAFDASTDYWSGAFKMANSGYYTVDLKETDVINAVSICLQKGVQQSATIEYSADSITWTTLKTYTNVTHYTVDYTSFSPVAARYVRVNVTGSAGKIGLNEINIFRSADTYEDYVYGIAPYGYTPSDAASPDFWVSEGVVPLPSGYKSKRALYMYDNDGTNKELSKVGYSAGAKKTFVFNLRTKGFSTTSGCVQFRLVSGTTNVFRMAVFPDGVLKYYNGAWHNIGAGTVSVPLDTWKAIKVVADASANTASVYVDGVLIGSNVTKETTSATTINGFLFASGGSTATGDKALFDDVDLLNTTTGLPSRIMAKEEKAVSQPMELSLSPNPAYDVVTVVVKNNERGPLEIYITDASGKRVKTLSYAAAGNQFSAQVPIQQLAPGLYIVTVKQGNTTLQGKLVK